MQYLVTMTTTVPAGTDAAVVDEIRERETVRAHELAVAHQLLRLWRPPLGPGEWRSLGLFEAADATELETVLASMPLRIWRSDQVEELMHHPNDPVVPSAVPREGREFLVRFTVNRPAEASEAAVARMSAREAFRIRQLADEGYVERLWMLRPAPAHWYALGLWRASGPEELQSLLRSLPMDEWMTVETTPLVPHPSDPNQQ